MRSSNKKTQFPANAKENPGRKAILAAGEKAKLVQNPSRGPKRRKSKAKGR